MIDFASGNPAQAAVRRGFRAADNPSVDHLLLQSPGPVPVVFWLPEVLHLGGLTPAQSVFGSSLFGLGGIVAVLYLGWAIDRLGARRSLAVHFAVGIVFIALIALAALPYFALLAVVFLSGTTGLGSADRSERGMRQALSGTHAHARLWVRDRRRTIGRHRRRPALAASCWPADYHRPLSFCPHVESAVIAAVATALLGAARQAAECQRGDRGDVVYGAKLCSGTFGYRLRGRARRQSLALSSR